MTPPGITPTEHYTVMGQPTDGLGGIHDFHNPPSSPKKHKWKPKPAIRHVFNDVPDEIILMITNQLGAPDLVSLAIVDKRFNRIVQDDLCKENKDMRDFYLRTWLHHAVQNNNMVMVQRLVAVGADIHARDKDNITPIYLAGRQRNAVIASILLSAEPDLRTFCRKDAGVLHAAAFLGDYPLFLRIIRDTIFDEDELCDSYPPQIFPRGNRRLLDFSRTFQSGITILHAAAFGGNTSIIQRVVEFGTDVNVKNMEKVTPLHVAAFANEPLAIAKLVALGASINYIDFFGRSAFSIAKAMGNEEAVNWLHSRGNRRGTRRRFPFPFD